LQQCSTPRGAIAILALDQRGNLRQALNPAAPDSVSAEEMTAFKQAVVAVLAPAASAVLLDPEFGAAQCVASGALPGNRGLLVALEATGYSGDPLARETRLLDGWSAAKTRQMGASAVKLLVYYHPEAPTAKQIEDLVRAVSVDCAASDLPLCVEPLSYSLDPQNRKLSPVERREVVIETARCLTLPGVDVLKAEFPVDVTAEPDESIWHTACANLSRASAAPWVLLSAGVDYPTYLRQVAVACAAGASGVAAGRAVWKEATQLTGEARAHFLVTTARERMVRLTALVEALARPWTDFWMPEPISAEWYRAYARGS
jgi:tagatose-1,6-bisphosphate aldolase